MEKSTSAYPGSNSMCNNCRNPVETEVLKTGIELKQIVEHISYLNEKNVFLDVHELIYLSHRSKNRMGEFMFHELHKNGITIDGKKFQVKIGHFVCDAPAKSYILNVKGHCGYNSCTKCYIVGARKKGGSLIPSPGRLLWGALNFTRTMFNAVLNVSKKSKDEKKAEKVAIKNVKKNLFNDIEAIEPLHSALSSAVNVFAKFGKCR